MLVEQGFHGTGLKPLLDRVKVPKGSFYNYFASKEDFCVQVIDHYAAKLVEQVTSALRTANRDALAALRKYFRELSREFDGAGCKGGCLVGNLGGELDNSEPCRDALTRALRAWRDQLRRAISLAQEQGSLRDDLGATEMADFLINAWEGAVLRMKIEKSTKPLKQCLKFVLDDFFQP